LSRNAKAGSKAERDALRQEMLAAHCSQDLIAQEMQQRWGFRPREAHRHAVGWSQDQVAARFTETAARIRSDGGQLSPMIGTRIGEYERWPHGGRRPSTYVLTVLAVLYETTVDRLLDYDDYRHLPEQDRTVLNTLLSCGAATAAPAAVQVEPLTMTPMLVSVGGTNHLVPVIPAPAVLTRPAVGSPDDVLAYGLGSVDRSAPGTAYAFVPDTGNPAGYGPTEPPGSAAGGIGPPGDAEHRMPAPTSTPEQHDAVQHDDPIQHDEPVQHDSPVQHDRPERHGRVQDDGPERQYSPEQHGTERHHRAEQYNRPGQHDGPERQCPVQHGGREQPRGDGRAAAAAGNDRTPRFPDPPPTRGRLAPTDWADQPVPGSGQPLPARAPHGFAGLAPDTESGPGQQEGRAGHAGFVPRGTAAEPVMDGPGPATSECLAASAGQERTSGHAAPGRAVPGSLAEPNRGFAARAQQAPGPACAGAAVPAGPTGTADLEYTGRMLPAGTAPPAAAGSAPPAGAPGRTGHAPPAGRRTGAGPALFAGQAAPAGAAGDPAGQSVALVTAATSLTPAAGLAGGLEIGPRSGSAARRWRRDHLMDRWLIGEASVEEEVIMAAAEQSAEFSEWAEATNVGTNTLDQFDQDIRTIARSYLRSHPLPLVLDTIRLRNRAFTLLEGRQHPNQSRRLYVIAGRACGLLAWMSGDVGRTAEAETQARTGWLCAEIADNDGLRAWIRATQSKSAYWDGRIHDSARLAEAGLECRASDTARVLLASLAARAWARLGRAEEAHAAIARASNEREAVTGEDEVGGLYGFSEAQQSYLAGSTYLYLKESTEALRAADRAVWLYEIGAPDERFYGAEMIALIDAATAHLQADELEGAIEKLNPVLELPPQQRLETFTTRLGEMREALRRNRYAGSRIAVDLLRHIEEFRSNALGQYLSR
jgi:tetratricopeptide (TPR) repeat protein